MRNKKLIITSVIIAIILIIYTGLWFLMAHQLKELSKDLSYEADNWKISHKTIEVSGFPFNFDLKLKDVNIVYNNKFLKLKIDTNLDTLGIRTNTAFTYVKFMLPKEMHVDTYYNQKFNQWNFSTKHRPHIKIAVEGLFNTIKIAELIIDPNKFEDQNYNLKEVHYLYKELNFIDKVSNKIVLNSNTDTKLEMDRKSEKKLNISLKSSSDINFSDSDYIGHKFKKITYKADINLETQRANKTYSSVPLIDVNLLNLSLDKHKISISGDIRKTNNESKTDLKLKIWEWQSLLNSLLEQKIISLDKKAILDNVMQEITGKEKNEQIETEIYTSKEGLIRIGKADIGTVNDYLKQFMVTN
jgi:hypothetical protein